MSASPRPAARLQWLLNTLSFSKATRLGIGPVVAAIILIVIVAITLVSPWIVPHDPMGMDALQRLKPPTDTYPLGTDGYGRDLLSRVLMGGQVSLLIGIGAAIISVLFGLFIGLIAGFFRFADAIIMRIMDSLMAIPSILLAIALIALNGPSICSVLAAITIPEIPRVVRLVRSIVLSAREEPYIEAALSLGSSTPKIIWQHLMPNTLAPLTVQATYVCASAILTEAILSFLGAGVSTEIPTWGNIMAEGRLYFQLKPSLIFWPGLLLSLCILSINLLGDTARDLLDPRLKKREG
ncbi:ABC transporter permease [Ochrobactrum sp. S1502_03]|uniref:ABC transporter permease n=1 Tax=Ochrobactrum sp. S1502_03 TaxID=3108451 RepID=UPI0037C9BFCE